MTEQKWPNKENVKGQKEKKRPSLRDNFKKKAEHQGQFFKKRLGFRDKFKKKG